VTLSGFQQDEKTKTGWGNYVVITYADGSQSLYAHLQPGTAVPHGSVVAGQQVALSDTTGGAVGPHLHVEYAPNGKVIRKSSSKIDPSSCFIDSDPFQTYIGTFEGRNKDNPPITDTGSFSVAIYSSTGRLTGTAVSALAGQLNVMGIVNANGNLSFLATSGGASNGASFSGTLDSNAGTIKGTWINNTNPMDVYTGTFNGSRNSSTK
jgi:murein DD-endopeptidase MepM/ murein hydrolase activator NlpD